ncbi:hypothetical protein [Flavobacterium sp.]|jgi:hypothetical protein|uniref:hypothetical protein n=1 Tax=Flavobacterium sp. TaxID=239 RepID=UPI0037C154E2
MTTKNKYYLLASILTLVLTFVAILQTFETVTIIGFETEIIWIPIWIAIVILPLLNLYEIVVHTDEINKYSWISLSLNIGTILFILRYFKIELLP